MKETKNTTQLSFPDDLLLVRRLGGSRRWLFIAVKVWLKGSREEEAGSDRVWLEGSPGMVVGGLDGG